MERKKENAIKQKIPNETINQNFCFESFHFTN